jgi:hypothetical protein
MIINIEVSGMGGEIVMGTLTPADHKTITDYMERNGIEKLEDFYEGDLFHSPETEELGISPWNEVDDLVHTYGPNDECDITFTDEDGDVLYEGGLGDLKNDTELYVEVDEEFSFDEPNKILHASQGEEGTWVVEFEITGGFDIKKFGFRERNVITPWDESGAVIDNLTYDGVKLDTLEGLGGDLDPLYLTIA